MFDYPVTLEQDAETGAVVVGFPDIPFCHSVGDDPDEALLNAIDALETALSVCLESRQPLPSPSVADGRPTVRPSALECAKLGIYQAMTEQGIRKAELARRLGWHMPQVDRLLDLRHASRLDQIETAARALGRTLDVRVTE
jgi:antitoxin HicB